MLNLNAKCSYLVWYSCSSIFFMLLLNKSSCFCLWVRHVTDLTIGLYHYRFIVLPICGNCFCYISNGFPKYLMVNLTLISLVFFLF